MGRTKKFYQTDEFKRLERKFYSNYGLEIDDDSTVIQPGVFTPPNQRVQSKGGLEYYQLCQAILREFKFKKELHRRIFELHTEGKSIRDIAAKLKISKDIVNYTVQSVHKKFQK